jgi:hypothetical protein
MGWLKSPAPGGLLLIPTVPLRYVPLWSVADVAVSCARPAVPTFHGPFAAYGQKSAGHGWPLTIPV